MKRRALAVIGLSLLAVACPGAKPPAAPPAPSQAAAPAAGPLVWHLSKSGLGFRLSNADEEADKPVERKVAQTTPMPGDEERRIAARLPQLQADPDDFSDFNMRAKSIPAPRPGKTIAEPFPPPAGPAPVTATPPGPLTLERHAPEGPVDLAPHLTMTFSQPMVAVTSVDDIAKERLPVSLVPQPPGKWRWLGTRTLMFQPEKRFPMATEYAVDVPAGTRSLAGQGLGKPEHWTFSTPPVTLRRSWPGGSSEPRDPLLFAEFDQAIDANEMIKSIELSSGRGAVAVKLADADEVEANDAVRRYAQQAEKGRWLAFRPTTQLPTATGFSVRIKAGAPSAEGPRRTTKDQAFSFSTFGPLRVTQARCSTWREKCVPLEAFQLQFSNPIDLKTFDKSMVKVTPEIPGMKVEVHGTWMSVRGRTKGRTHYDVTVLGTIADVHGQTMGADKTSGLEVGPADPTLFAAEKPMIVLDPAAPRSYTVYSINEPTLHVRVLAVTPEDWARYHEFSDEWERPRKIRPPGRVVFDKIVQPKKQPDELVATPIDLSPALAGSYGQALVVVESTRPMKRGYFPPETHVWVQSTDLGLDAVVEEDEVIGWATKLADGTPQGGVDVELLGAGSAKTDREGLAKVAFKADKTGTLLVAKRGKDTVIAPEQWWGRPEYRVVGRADAVRWFVFDDRGMYKPGEEVHVKGFVRRAGVARGGDLDLVKDAANATLSFTVKDPRWAEIGKGTATLDDQGGFDLSFKLPANANLGNAHVELSLPTGLAGSTFSHDFEVQEFRRPEFEVTARSSEGPHFVGEHAIATLTASYYSGGGLPDAPVTWSVTRSTVGYTPPNRGDFHFGPPPSSWWDWRAQRDPKNQPKTETWTSHTSPAGVHRLRVDFDALEPSYPMSLALTGTVEDVNRQGWAGRTSMLVHPADFYVGLRTAKQFIRAGENVDLDVLVTDVDGKLASGRAVKVKAARIDWEQKGEEYEEKELDATTCDVVSPNAGGIETSHCALRTTQGGQWRVTAIVEDAHGRKSQSATTIWVMGQENPKDHALDKGKVTVVADKKEYQPGDLAEVLVIAPFTPAEGLLTLRRQGVVHVERFSMKSASQAIKLKLEDGYVPNVEIAVQLVGADVRLNAAGEPDPKLPKRPAYAAGSITAKVLPTTRTLAVKAAPKRPTIEPGGSTQIDVEVKDPSGRGVGNAEVAVVVADEAILALSGYKTPDPVSVFYSPRAADAHDVAMRDDVILADPDLTTLRAEGERAAANAPGGFGSGHGRLGGLAGIGSGGGGAAAAPPMAAPMASATGAAKRMAKTEAAAGDRDSDGIPDDKDAEETKENAGKQDDKKPIQLRADFSPLALFAPKVRTDGSGHATVPVKLPDNLTRYRVMAVAASGDRMFGADESTITAKLPLMVRPSAPRFLNFGDRFELPIVVQNQTDAPIDVGVVVRATNATIDAPDAKKVKVPANDRVEVRFHAATVKAGTARFQIGVSSGGFSDASQISLPVYTPATTEAFATYGEVDEGATSQQVKMPPGVFPQFGGLEITTSSTQLQALTDAVVYLVKYPFECNEQLASRVISIAALKDVLTAFKAAGLPPPKDLLASMKTDFEKLKRHQHWNGGWGFWQEEPWPYLTVHVAHALQRAKEKGFEPDAEMLRRAQGYLETIESHYPSWYTPEWRRVITSYALYVLDRMGKSNPAKAKRVIAEAGGVEKLPIEALGWLWPTISKDAGSSAENEAIRRHVANRVTETAGNAHFVTGYQDGDWVLLSSDRRADGVLLEAIIGDQPQSTLIPKLVKGLLDHRKAGRWVNTQENAFVLLALDRYFDAYEKVTPDFVARVWLGDRFAGEHAFKGRTTERDHVAIPMQWLATEMKGPQDLVLGKDGPGRMYYRIGMQYAPTDLKLPPADNGFVVSRTYEGADDPNDVKRDQDGTWRVKAGTKVRVRVSMVAQSRRYHVALVDPIPAGLEPMNPALAVTGEIPKDPKEATRHESRYWYWSRTWYEHQNMRDERVEAFASLLWDGVWDYTYVAKATTPGVFVVPPPKAEEMYAPETFGRGAGDRMIVE